MVNGVIKINPGEYYINENPNDIIYLKGLENFIGLGLIEENQIRKRGLGYIFLENNYDLDIEKKNINKFLINFICDFKENNFNKINDFDRIQALLVFNNMNFKERYNEELAESYIMSWLLNNGINLKISDGISYWNNKRIYSKEVGLHYDKLVIVYRDKLDNILNYNDTNDRLD